MSNTALMTLAGHDYRSAARNRVLGALLVTLLVVTTVSVLIAAFDYQTKIDAYRQYKDAAIAAGIQNVAPLQVRPLQLMRPVVEYIEFVGAVIAIALGYLSVARERANRTVWLLRTRPVSSSALTFGPFLGAIGLISTLVVATAAIGVISIGVWGHDWLNGEELVRLALWCIASIVYMAIFYCLGAALTARSRVLANGLVAALVVWLAVVLIIPQIGDTMDPDNQLPGGLFRSMNLDKSHETRVLAKFGTYERLRNDLEEVSFAKQYERFSFAILEIKLKDTFRDTSISHVLNATRRNTEWLALYAAVMAGVLYYTVSRSTAHPKGEDA
ncbi:MAG TPA: ABC transporter permease [Thermomicrobiales bacterium]|jgi:ABC-2 type transport system permease protein|nr:ABC transporter permease [Thermomicrobiales bacterium]